MDGKKNLENGNVSIYTSYSHGGNGDSRSEVTHLIRKTNRLHTVVTPPCALSYPQTWHPSHFDFKKIFSGRVEKNKSLGAPVNSSVWGVHSSEQLSFENCLYCSRLPIAQSGGCVKSIKQGITG